MFITHGVNPYIVQNALKRETERETWIFMGVSIPYTWSFTSFLCCTFILKFKHTMAHMRYAWYLRLSGHLKQNSIRYYTNMCKTKDLPGKKPTLSQKWNRPENCSGWVKQWHFLVQQQCYDSKSQAEVGSLRVYSLETP